MHRDVKPGNMLVKQDGHLILADFGIARVAEDIRTLVTGQVTSCTLPYMSPEQLMGEDVDRRSDLYSLAVSLYQLLIGRPPFYTRDIATQIRLKTPVPIPGLPDYANAALLKGLAKEPHDRQSTCAALVAELAGGVPIEARVPLERPRKGGDADLAGRRDDALRLN